MDKLTGLRFELLGARKSAEKYNLGVEDIRNMFKWAGYENEFDESRYCRWAYKAGYVTELIDVSIAMIDYMKALDFIGARENI